MAHTTIVVPCYNEAKRLSQDAFLSYAGPERFLFVNDGSKDETLDVLKALCEKAPERLSYLDLPQNGGKADAVRQGLLEAIDAGAQFVGFWDADLATPLDVITPFREMLEARPELEVVMGSRVRLLGRSIERQAIRHYLGRVGATMASLVLGIPVYDTQCGAKMFRVSEMWRRVFAEPFQANWMFDVEILARFIREREALQESPAVEAVYEYPLQYWHDVAGSKVTGADFPKAFIELSKIYIRYKL